MSEMSLQITRYMSLMDYKLFQGKDHALNLVSNSMPAQKYMFLEPK